MSQMRRGQLAHYDTPQFRRRMIAFQNLARGSCYTPIVGAFVAVVALATGYWFGSFGTAEPAMHGAVYVLGAAGIVMGLIALTKAADYGPQYIRLPAMGGIAMGLALVAGYAVTPRFRAAPNASNIEIPDSGLRTEWLNIADVARHDVPSWEGTAWSADGAVFVRVHHLKDNSPALGPVRQKHNIDSTLLLVDIENRHLVETMQAPVESVMVKTSSGRTVDAQAPGSEPAEFTRVFSPVIVAEPKSRQRRLVVLSDAVGGDEIDEVTLTIGGARVSVKRGFRLID